MEFIKKIEKSLKKNLSKNFYFFILNLYRFRHCFYNLGKIIGFFLNFKNNDINFIFL